MSGSRSFARAARFGVGLAVIGLAAAGAARGGETPATTDVLLKVKPSVVIVTTKISGEVRLTCPNASPQRVIPEPIQAHGTGFLITADGYLVTNGHVVQPYYEANEPELRTTLLRQAVEQACVPANLPEARRRSTVNGLAARLANSARVEMTKNLIVRLSNRETFVGEVKAYSPPLAERPGKHGAAGLGPVTESGKDIAIVKIDAKNLPTVALGDSDGVRLGQRVRLLGFPGVVMYHDLLDKRSAMEASVTAGQISSVKRDTRGAPIIQTDAAASWGNSGGPAVDDEGRVVGVLTFISLNSDETQAIQGFNFLVPANIVREFARAAGADLGAPSPFNAVWHDAVDRFGRKDWAGARAKLDAAARLVPNLPDVQTLQSETEIHLLQDRRSPHALVLGVSGALLLLVSGACWWGWRRRGSRRVSAEPAPTAEESVVHHPVVRVSAAELGRALAQRADLAVVDVRGPTGYERSTVQAKGAIRSSIADIAHEVSALAPEQGIIVYCDLPDEAASAEAARKLTAAGYTRVAVLTGGFAAWEAASLPLERTPHARGMTTGARPALPAPAATAGRVMDTAVDLPVGVKGSGPYFNARATRLGLDGLALRLPAALAAGERVRLTVFVAGEPIEVGAQIVASNPAAADGQYTAEVAFEPLREEQATALEGIILAHRTAR